MTWRRANETLLGDDPPPARPLLFRPQNLIVHLRWRTVETIASLTGGSTSTTDSGWSDWVTLDEFAWPTPNVASRGGSTNRSTAIHLQTGGRAMPWRMVNELTLQTTVGFTTTTTTSLEILDVNPGEEQVFNYSCSGTSSLHIYNTMLLTPADGR